MGVLPADPRVHSVIGKVEIKSIDAERNSAKDFAGSQGYKTQVTSGSEIGIDRKDCLGLHAGLVKGANGESSIDTRYETDDDWGAGNEQDSDPSIIGIWVASDFLKDIEAMTFRDDF